MSGRSGSHLGVAALVVYWLVQAATLGISDDEAYYWVLSRSPALGYTYHPPMVAWLIRASDFLFGWLLCRASSSCAFRAWHFRRRPSCSRWNGFGR